MRNILLGLSAVVALAAGPASAEVLTFDGNICSDGNACSNFAPIDQSYGDIAGKLDVIYDGNSDSLDRFQWWADSYSTLTGVAFGYEAGVEIFLKPLAGYQVTLLGFDIGSWPNSSRTSSVRVFSGNLGTTFLNTGDIVIPGAEPSHFAINETRSDGFRIQFGPENYNVGIDNIAFRVTATGAIPEPATWALMIGGFGAAGAMLRRRRALAAA